MILSVSSARRLLPPCRNKSIFQHIPAMFVKAPFLYRFFHEMSLGFCKSNRRASLIVAGYRLIPEAPVSSDVVFGNFVDAVSSAAP